MGEFMGEDGDRLFARETAHEGDRKDDHGAEDPGHDRAAYILRPEHDWWIAKFDPCEGLSEGGGPFGLADKGALTACSVAPKKSPNDAGHHEGESEEVEADQPDRERGFLFWWQSGRNRFAMERGLGSCDFRSWRCNG
jgi:hypothetical protein